MKIAYVGGTVPPTYFHRLLEKAMAEETKSEPIIFKDKINTDLESLAVVSQETTMPEVEGCALIPRLRLMLEKKNATWVKGHGLAAIQIGVPVRVAVYQTTGGMWVTLLNPVILEKSDLRAKTSREACLSIPNKWYNTYRYERVVVESGPADARYKIEATGLEAWILQHEIDHMDGILCDTRTTIQERNARCACGSGKKFKKCCGA